MSDDNQLCLLLLNKLGHCVSASTESEGPLRWRLIFFSDLQNADVSMELTKQLRIEIILGLSEILVVRGLHGILKCCYASFVKLYGFYIYLYIY